MLMSLLNYYYPKMSRVSLRRPWGNGNQSGDQSQSMWKHLSVRQATRWNRGKHWHAVYCHVLEMLLKTSIKINQKVNNGKLSKVCNRNQLINCPVQNRRRRHSSPITISWQLWSAPW